MTPPDLTPEQATKRLFIYEVEPSHEDGRGTSGWTVTVATDRCDLSDLARIVRVHLLDADVVHEPENWTGIKSAKLLTTAVLDPRIA